MKNFRLISPKLPMLILSILVASLVMACEDTSVDPHDDHMAEVAFSYSPTTAAADAEITLLFEVEEAGMHMSVTNAACEIHGIGGIALTEGETGHYRGVHIFPEAGVYEVHFSFMFEEMMMEEEFSITVN